MKHYAVATLTITDPGWVADYVAQVTGMVERHGGCYLARTTRTMAFEGRDALPQVVLLIEWPSKDAATSFYESEEYRPYREARSAGSKGAFWLVPGEDVNGVARIEPHEQW